MVSRWVVTEIELSVEAWPLEHARVVKAWQLFEMRREVNSCDNKASFGYSVEIEYFA